MGRASQHFTLVSDVFVNFLIKTLHKYPYRMNKFYVNEVWTEYI